MPANSKNEIVCLEREKLQDNVAIIRRIMIITGEKRHDWHYRLMFGGTTHQPHMLFFLLPSSLQNFFYEMEVVVNEDIQLNFLCCQQNALAYIRIGPHKNYTKLNKKGRTARRGGFFIRS
jgi:hypothetical protein